MATHTFPFHGMGPQSAPPYIAAITLPNDEGDWLREHKPLEATVMKNHWVIRKGNYTTVDGEVLEAQYGKRRRLFIVREGAFIALGECTPESKGIVEAYLRGEITVDDIYHMPQNLNRRGAAAPSHGGQHGDSYLLIP